ncbi:putative protein phosphatase type 1 complex subunit Hex2/Reg1 [Aspergillus bombycis]|uniref:Nitrogen regulatory protein areA GATA-like domain-containing protein n=1 Tax=Aspergillus bombycis TaxID=109264 RepID=A0A1F7ZPH0_9EURO|nr:putative protein phosphatase type 1 complex subunit Hex2/Reg1 [Aspergillus bombycis]OGM41354.1 putative protein phosphatase type 1 complex subunit Hex2/Reg1 [Aspergillus bombycis]
MAAVLSASQERHTRLSPDPLRCPIAQRYFLEDSDVITVKSPTNDYSPRDCPTPIVSSALSPFPHSPDFAGTAPGHLLPTPTTIGSLSFCVRDGQNDDDDDDVDEIILPSYDAGPCLPKLPEAPSEASTESSTDLHRMNLPRPADDSLIEEEPSRHVDYLAHEWKEEDIWTSWRYVVARREIYDHGVRLENASWRTWAKLKLNRGTVSPETLNWLKDYDVTWLYGPLKSCRKRKTVSNVSPPPSRLETPTDRKPILKKRTASETILQRSLSQHTLLQHAGAILKAQEAEVSRNRPSFYRYPSNLGHTFSQSSEGYSRTSCTATPINGSSGTGSPCEKRHIHFNNEVVQCIAVEVKYDDDDDDWPAMNDDFSSDDGVVMMRHGSWQTSTSERSTTPRSSFSSDNRTIAPLPSTTLKYRGDTPEPPPVDSILNRWSGYFSSYSSHSVETTQASEPTANFFLDEADNDLDFNWEPAQRLHDSTDRSRPWFVNPEDDAELDRHCLSASGASYDDAESANASIFDRVVDTVNTAKDIAHVIWNVGWRR